MSSKKKTQKSLSFCKFEETRGRNLQRRKSFRIHSIRIVSSAGRKLKTKEKANLRRVIATVGRSNNFCRIRAKMSLLTLMRAAEFRSCKGYFPPGAAFEPALYICNWYEIYCWSNIRLHLVHQRVINFQTFWVIISLHRKYALKYIFLHISKRKFPRVKRTF